MIRIILTSIIVLLIFTYVVPEKNAEQIPYGAQIQLKIQTTFKPVQILVEQTIGMQVSQLIDAIKLRLNSQINGQKVQLEQQVNGQINKGIDSAMPTIPSTKK